MNPIVTFDNIRSFAYVNAERLSGCPKGIVVSFFGLGNMAMFDEDPYEGKFFAEQNILYLVPYTNPWGWMNRAEAKFTDELIAVLCDHYGCDLPVVSTGGSMGGLAALAYCKRAAKTPIACVANCPVCDLLYHYTERPDLPRTLYAPFFDEAEGDFDKLEAAMRGSSPLHLVDVMPKIPYHIYHCTADLAVNKEMHSDRFVAAMEQAGKSVSYCVVPDRGHCDLGDRYPDYLQDAVNALK